MCIENKIKKSFIRRTAIWASITVALFVVCYFYQKYARTEFAPAAAIALILLISFIIFNTIGLLAYYTDKSFSGMIIDLKVDVIYVRERAFERTLEQKTYVGMTVECDNGQSTFYEEVMPASMIRTIPFRKGDRVYHIKGAKHICRFPRNDKETKYDPISVICPLCGFINQLGITDCAFCGNDLPYDPSVR